MAVTSASPAQTVMFEKDVTPLPPSAQDGWKRNVEQEFYSLQGGCDSSFLTIPGALDFALVAAAPGGH